MLFLYQINVDPFNHSITLHCISLSIGTILFEKFPSLSPRLSFLPFFSSILCYIYFWYIHSGNDGGNRFGECIGWSWKKFKTTETLQYKTTNRCQSRRKFLLLLADDAHNVHFIQFLDAYCSTKLSRITGLYFMHVWEHVCELECMRTQFSVIICKSIEERVLQSWSVKKKIGCMLCDRGKASVNLRKCRWKWLISRAHHKWSVILIKNALNASLFMIFILS